MFTLFEALWLGAYLARSHATPWYVTNGNMTALASVLLSVASEGLSRMFA